MSVLLHARKLNKVSNSKSDRVPYNYKCFRCGVKASHYVNKCPAINKTCLKCNIKGHLSRLCKSKVKNAHALEQVEREVATNGSVGSRAEEASGGASANHSAGRNGPPFQRFNDGFNGSSNGSSSQQQSGTPSQQGVLDDDFYSFLG